MNFRALIRRNLMFWVGKKHSSYYKVDELVSPNGNSVWVSYLSDHGSLWLSSFMHCFVLVV